MLPTVSFTTVIIAILVAIGLYYFISNLLRIFRNIPPGPVSLPVFGYLPFFGLEPYKDLCRLAKKYGRVFSLYLGTSRVVVIGEWEVMKEALTSQSFLGRPPYTVLNLIPDSMGMGTTNGPDWQHQRKFVMQELKHLTGKVNNIEDTIQEDLATLISDMEDRQGEPMTVRKYLTQNSINNIWRLLCGERLPFKHPQLEFMDSVLNVMADYFGFATACGFLPWLANVLVSLRIGGYDTAISVLKRANEMFNKEIEMRKDSGKELIEEQFITGYLRVMSEKTNTREHSSFTIPRLRGTMQALFLGGSETVRSSIEWALLSMAAYPDVQKKIQKEIDEVVGRERSCAWEDRVDMPFTMAVIFEMQRWKTVAPLSPPRYAVEDGSLDGYHIPQGTTIMVNIWAVHNDPKYWDKPEEFCPERFLSGDGTKTVKRESFAPFTLGKRRCPGDEMALTIIFFYLVTILQKFDIKMPEGVRADVDSYKFGVTYQPIIQEMCFHARN